MPYYTPLPSPLAFGMLAIMSFLAVPHAYLQTWGHIEGVVVAALPPFWINKYILSYTTVGCASPLGVPFWPYNPYLGTTS